MSVEQAQTIDQLNISLPRNVDLIREGDDHIRLLKSTTKNTFPKIKGVVNFSSERLNNLDVAIESVDKEGNLTLSKSLTMKRGGSVNMNDTRVQFVGTPVDETDAVNVKFLKEIVKTDGTSLLNLLYPVGIVITMSGDTDPNIKMDFGTWVKFAEGRTLIGSGKFTDLNADQADFKNGEVGGHYNQKVTKENLPKFSLKVTGQTNSKGDHKHGTSWGETRKGRYGNYDNTRGIGSGDTDDDNQHYATSTDGAHIHEVTGKTEEIGEDKPFSLVQPYLVVTYWTRTK